MFDVCECGVSCIACDVFDVCECGLSCSGCDVFDVCVVCGAVCVI